MTKPTTRAATAPAETVMINVSRLKRTTLASTVGLSDLKKKKKYTVKCKQRYEYASFVIQAQA